MRLGKRERAQQRERVIASHNVASLMGQDKFFMSHTGKVCQNIKGSFTKHKTSQALFDICQRVK